MASLIGILNMDMNYPGIQIKVELIVMREYLSQMEAGINSVCNSYLEKEERNVSGQEYDEYRHIYQIAEDEIPRIIRLPFLVSIYTLYENSITQLLKYAQEKENKELGLNDINANSLSSKFNKYIAHILNYDFKFNNNIMNNISELTKLRNCIAHANGNINSLSISKANEISTLANGNTEISVSNNQLDISYIYLNEAMNTVSNAIQSLMQFIEKRYGFL